MAEEDCLEVVLLGKTGNGKSSLGNSILGDEVFHVEEIGLQSVTQTCHKDTRNNVTVIDTPGLFDMRKSVAQQGMQLVSELTKVVSNPHAFLVVFSGSSRLTQEELLTVELLDLIFGEKFFEHAIVVFTNIKEKVSDADFESFLDKSEEMQKIIAHCRGRVIRIDNDGKKKYRNKRIEELMVVIRNLTDNGMKRFCFSEMHEMAFQRVGQLKTDKDKFDIDDIRNDISRIVQSLQDIRRELLERQERAEREARERLEREARERAEKEKLKEAEKERQLTPRRENSENMQLDVMNEFKQKEKRKGGFWCCRK